MYKNIVFPVDLLDGSSWKMALPVVLDFLKNYDTTIHVINVISDSGMNLVSQYFPGGAEEKILENARTHIHEFVDKNFPDANRVKCVIARGPVYECVINFADQIDSELIVMTAHRPELKDYLLGPNAAKVVRHSNRSVFVVRDPSL